MATHDSRRYTTAVAHEPPFAINPNPSMKSFLCALCCSALLLGLTSCRSDDHRWSKQADTMGTTVTPSDSAPRTFDSSPTPGKKALETLPANDEPAEVPLSKTAP